MGGCGENCACVREEVNAQALVEADGSASLVADGVGKEVIDMTGMEGSGTADDPYRVPTLRDITAEQPEGWHPCLKQKTRCTVALLEHIDEAPYTAVSYFTAYNSCHVGDAEECPRVTAESQTGEDYDLCGPPNHAEQEAAKLILQHFPDGAPDGAVARLYGHTYLCGPCQEALIAANIRMFIVTGEPA